jgi:transposase
MLKLEAAMEIRILQRQGVPIRAIARELGVARNTVRRYVRDEKASTAKPRLKRVSKLDAHRTYVEARLKAAAPDRVPVTVLLNELRGRGYTGGYTILCDFVAGLRPPPPAEPVIRFETGPGQQLQVDWAVFRRGGERLLAFVAVLAWSRFSYVEFARDASLETLLGCHEAAFAALGGVPREILYDNMKTVVLTRDAYGPGQHRFTGAFYDFARHHGFRPRLCRPYRARTKGKVERFIGYLRRSFFVPFASRLEADGLVVDDLAANAAVARWLREVANARTHGTTGVAPSERLVVERAHLQPLAAPYGGSVRRARPGCTRSSEPAPGPVAGYHHPLGLYDELFAGSAS